VTSRFVVVTMCGVDGVMCGPIPAAAGVTESLSFTINLPSTNS